MKIKKATIKDFESLKRLKILSKKEELNYSPSLRPLSKTKEYYFRYLKSDLKDKERAIFIAMEDKKIIGMILGKYYKPIPISKFKKKGYISNLYFDKKYRKKGIGKKLVMQTMRWLKKQGVAYISLEIHSKNLATQRLYKKFGFKDYTIKLAKKI